jgi:hypothetical protein
VSRRARRWWHGVEAEAEPGDPPGPATARDGEREPWADRALAVAALTADQRALLAGLDDQPDHPHLDGLTPADVGLGGTADGALTPADQPAVPRLRSGNRTGNAPGETPAARPYRRTRWTEPEQER